MFSSASKIVIFSSTALGFGGLGLFGGNELSKTTISDSLGEVKPVSESYDEKEEGIWPDLFSYFFHHNNSSKSKKFRGLFSGLSSKENFKDNEIKSSSKKLEKLCKESYGELYSSFLGKSNDDLKSDVEVFCSIQVIHIPSKIKIFLDFSGGKHKSNDKETWIKNLNSLKSSVDVNPELDSGLSSIKQSIQEKSDLSQEDESINSLLEWCSGKAKTYYISREVNKMDLVEKYCIREEKKTR